MKKSCISLIVAVMVIMVTSVSSADIYKIEQRTISESTQSGDAIYLDVPVGTNEPQEWVVFGTVSYTYTIGDWHVTASGSCGDKGYWGPVESGYTKRIKEVSLTYTGVFTDSMSTFPEDPPEEYAHLTTFNKFDPPLATIRTWYCVPLPSTIYFLGSGLAGVIAFGRRRLLRQA